MVSASVFAELHGFADPGRFCVVADVISDVVFLRAYNGDSLQAGPVFHDQQREIP